MDNTLTNTSNNELQLVYSNLIQIELDYKPQEFTQNIENKFLRQLEILLQQSGGGAGTKKQQGFTFNNPKVILMNTRTSISSTKSSSSSSCVVLEVFVCEDESSNSGGGLTGNVFDFKKYARLEEVS